MNCRRRAVILSLGLFCSLLAGPALAAVGDVNDAGPEVRLPVTPPPAPSKTSAVREIRLDISPKPTPPAPNFAQGVGIPTGLDLPKPAFSEKDMLNQSAPVPAPPVFPGYSSDGPEMRLPVTPPKSGAAAKAGQGAQNGLALGGAAGEEPWHLAADRIVGQHGSEFIEAVGGATLVRGLNSLKADFIRYYQASRWVILRGNVRILWDGDVVQAEEAEFDLASMEAERKAAAEREALLKDLQAQLQDNFKALSADALASNNQNFLQLAAQHLAKVQEAGRGDLELRQKSIEGLVKPIRDTLAQVDGQIRTLEKQRVEAYAGLTEQVRRMTAEQGDLRRETGRLVTALRKPTVRGRWGEIQLKRVVELAGMLNHCDFVEQASVSTEEGKLRPDMVVRLPGGRNVVVDSKAPLEAYLDAQDATDEDVRRQRMAAHAGAIREHMTKLGQKSYWEHLSPTPEFVVMFLPSEIFFSAALEQAPRLIEEGVGKGVIVASPTTLIALLRAVAYGWRQEQTAENAQKIAELGRELHKRVATLAEHFGKVGKGLGAAVDAYNGAVNSFESRVLVQTRRFTELGAASEKELPALDPVEKSPRDLPQNGE